MSEQEISTVRNDYKAYLETKLGNIASYTPKATILQEQWTGITWPTSDKANYNPSTGVDKDTLVRVGKGSVAAPGGFVSAIFWSQPNGDELSLSVVARRKSIQNCIGTSRIVCKVLKRAAVLIGQQQR